MTIQTGDVVEGEGWEVRCGKWQDNPPDQVDHIICDPPYDEETHAGGRHQHGDEIVENVISFDPIDPADIAMPLVEVADRWVLCFCAVEQLGFYREAAGDAWIRGGIWVKTNPTPQYSGDRPAVWGDGIAILHKPLSMGRKGRTRWNGIDGKTGKAAVWMSPFCTRDRVHETQKPLSLMRDLIKAFTDPGDLVYDPYGGSMTTGVAAVMAGRKFIGHEMNPDYAAVGVERLQAAVRGADLVSHRSGQGTLFEM